MLSYVMVLLIAGVVGLAVYVLVLRLGVERPPTDIGETTDPSGMSSGSVSGAPATSPAAPFAAPSEHRPERRAMPEGSYVPVSPASPSWHTRLGGVMGLVIAVTGAALGIAAGLYLVGHFVAHLLHSSSP